jgi:putative ABC transport system permease protein
MWRATWKSLLAKKLRLVLTTLSIVLGVGFVAGTYVLTDTMNAAFDEVFGNISQASDLLVRSRSAFQGEASGPGGGGGEERQPLDEAVVAQVAALPGVALAAGDVSGTAQMIDPVTDKAIGGVGPPTIGTNWNDFSDAVLDVREGRPPAGPGEVLIDAGTATAHDLRVGQDIEILFQGPPETFTIVGIAGFGETDNLAGATLAVFDLATAQRVLDKEGVVDDVSVRVADGASATTVQQEIQGAVGPNIEVLTSADVADEQSKALQEGLGFFRTVLLVFAAIALFVGAFIIFNTFSIIVAQRSRELALLRTLGASRRQVMVSVVTEAAVVGLLASLIGVVFGIGIAAGLRALLDVFGIDLPATALQLRPRTLVVALVVGLVVTVIAAIVPARHAAKVAPIQALQESSSTMGAHPRRRLITGAVALTAGIGLLLIGLFAKPANAAVLVGFGAAVTFIAVAMLSPLIARPVAGAIGAPIKRLSVQSRIGRENAMRNPRRTASTAVALTIGLGLVSMVTILGASLKASTTATLESQLRADIIVTSTSFAPFSTDAAKEIAALPEVAGSTAVRQGAFRVDGQTSFISAADPSQIDAVSDIGLREGSAAELTGDTVMVHADLAEEKGWALGDQIPSAFPSIGDRPLTIVGIYDENALVGDYLVSLSTYEDLFVQQLDTLVLATAAEGVSSEQLAASIQAALADFPNLEVQDQAAFRDKQAGFVDTLLNLVTALLAMSILIALFGIVNTLGLSIYERTRELGLLRAVGMNRRSVKRMIRWESVIIAIFGGLLGIVIGIGFGLALQRALEPEGVTVLDIPVRQLLIYLVLAGLAGVLAAIFPARRAAKLNVLEAVSYE